MKVLFLLLNMGADETASGMYVDLIDEFRANGHDVTIMAPDVNHTNSYIHEERGIRVLRVKSKETQGIGNMIKKGFALATLSFFYKKAFDKFLKYEKFDWIFMPTPPITLVDFVQDIKKKTGAKFYLILRDIHPHSAASIGLIKNKLMFNFLLKRERKGYLLSDKIGCMSQGNIDFVIGKYPNLDKNKLVLLYNWQSDVPKLNNEIDIRAKYQLDGKFLALFGGNLGLGQRVENIVSLAKHYLDNENIVFVVIGKGVHKHKLEQMANNQNLRNIRFIDYMPRPDYLNFVRSADIGLISINENYAVPTCPSKAVSYLSLGIPIFAMINAGSDYGCIIENAGAGYWTVGGSLIDFSKFDKIYADAEMRKQMSLAGRKFYEENLTPQKAYSTIINQIHG